MNIDVVETAIQAGKQRLYNYQRFNETYLTDILLNHRVKFSNPSGFNDPWDCNPVFSKSILDDPTVYKRHVDYAVDLQRRYFKLERRALRFIRDKLQNDRAFLEERLDEISVAMRDAILKDYRVYCLATSPTNSLVWAFYAEKHSGVCIGFDTDSDQFCGALRVHYSQHYPTIDFSDDDSISFLRDSLLTKAIHWRHEDEFRVVAKEEDSDAFLALDDGFLEFPAAVLTSVTVGCLTSDTDLQRIKRILASRDVSVRLYRASRSPNQYEIERVRIQY